MKSEYIIYLLLSIILILPLLDLLHPGFPITHDGQDHIARIANFYQNLQNGIIIPRWAGNLNWGYGHPILMFLYPLPSYIASCFHFLGLSLIDSTKITFALGMILSGVTMYLWLSSFWGKSSSFLGAIMYVFAPYRFVDLYVRGDIGENLSFIFIPLVLFFIHKLSARLSFKYVIGGGLSLALLILSHNAISLMLLPFIIIYGIYKMYFYVKEKLRFFLYFCILVILGFGISAFFWIPALFEGKFTLRNIVTAGIYKDRFVSFKDLLYGPWSYGGSGQFTVQLGILQWFFLLTSVVTLPFLWFKKRKKFLFVFLLITFTLISIFFMLAMSKIIWQKILLLQNFQFPWRFIAVTVFSTAALGAYVIEFLPKNLRLLMVIPSIGIILFLSKDYLHAKSYSLPPEKFFTGIYNGTTDTGESAPIWSVRFMEKRPKYPLEVAGGRAKVTIKKRNVTEHIYAISVLSQNAKIVENTLYFPGWHVYVDNNEVPVEFQDQLHRGLMEFSVPKGLHKITIVFGETKLRLFSDMLSLISIVLILILMISDMRYPGLSRITYRLNL